MDLSKLKQTTKGHPFVTRRGALQSGLVATGMALTAATPGLAALRPDRTDKYPEEDFWTGLIEDHFHIKAFAFDDQTERCRRARLVLTEVRGVYPESDDPARPEFFRPCAVSLLFRGSGKYVLPSASYDIKHAQQGNFQLLLSHTAKHTNRRYRRNNMYEAILN